MCEHTHAHTHTHTNPACTRIYNIDRHINELLNILLKSIDEGVAISVAS